jgi:beta-lactam-binding protein with PASTA domain/serine/threonine protein kinase
VSTSESPPSGRIDAAQLVGDVIADHYCLVRLVSEGANTAIFDAIDEESGRSVTLKLIRPRLATSPTFRDRFDRDMRAAAALSHPNIAAVFDWGLAAVADTTTAYVVTEELGGGSLRDLFDRGRQLSPSQALAVGLDACRGLDYAHRRGMVHAELTPSKLVFGDDRRLRIVDFGLARLLGEPAWRQPDSVPNHVAWYAAPEQGAGGQVDGRTDVYALCLALHEAVTGTLPFKADSTVATLSARVGRLMPVSADLGPLAAVFERAGRPEQEDRATAAEFGKGLVRAASKLPRPEPLPLLASGLFDTPSDRMRSPADPTGGIRRPREATGATDVHVVPIDEPSPEPQPVVPDEPSREPASDPATVAPPADAGRDDEIVILPVDSGFGTHSYVPEPDAEATVTQPAAPVEVREAPPTQVMGQVPVGHAPTGRPRRRFPWKILLSLLVLAALAVLAVLATRLFETPEYSVPDLVELPEAEARNMVAANGWEISVSEERSDAVPTEGSVVRTVPGPGVMLAEGEPFLIVVSQGPILRALPDSTGLPLSSAQTRLVERGLVVGEVVEQHDEQVPVGTVISWSVPGDPTLVAGSEVEPGTEVELVVSIGPAPRVVPAVTGLATEQARQALEELQLVYVESAEEFSDDVPADAVIRQEVEAGTEVERGTEVSVVVSRGPDLVAFPDLSDATSFEDAAAILGAAGFEAELVFGDAQGDVQSYQIDGVQPAVGDMFRRGTLVTVQAFDPE